MERFFVIHAMGKDYVLTRKKLRDSEGSQKITMNILHSIIKGLCEEAFNTGLCDELFREMYHEREKMMLGEREFLLEKDEIEKLFDSLKRIEEVRIAWKKMRENAKQNWERQIEEN